MKKLFFLFFILLLSGNIGAQTLRGTAYEEASKKPISKVFVYLDGTSFHTTTDEAGRFELKVGKIINTQLVFSHLSYNTLHISNPFGKISDKFYLSEKDHSLKEVIIEANRFTRAQKLKAFREQFLGMTKAGKSCKILNEGDIHLSYDLHNNTLKAHADKPITIINDYLSYKILFSLVDFNAQYLEKSLDSKLTRQSYFAGTSLFVDLKPNDKKIKNRRDKVYKTSANYFFKHLAEKTLTESNHAVFNKGGIINPNGYFTIKDTLGQKLLLINPNTNINTKKLGFIQPAFAIISVLYEKKAQSEIFFLTDAWLVDQYGNISMIDKILFSGQMGEVRAGDLLPLDYELKQ